MSQSPETSEQTPIEQLKAGIWDIHEGVSNDANDEAVEQESVMKGNLPKYKYVNGVKQRYLLQREFEKFLDAHRHGEPFLNHVVTDEQFHAEKAAQDLRFFGVDPAGVKPVPATEKMYSFFHETAQRDPRLLLAIHYVIEGSNNGAMFIAKAVRECYGLEGTDGTYHLQPYGSEIRKKWKAWREAFNELDFDEALMNEMIRVGRETFHHMNAISREAHAQPQDGNQS